MVAVTTRKGTVQQLLRNAGSAKLNSNDKLMLAVGAVILLVGLSLLYIFVLSGPTAPQRVEMTLQAGDSLTEKVGFDNAIAIAENADLPIQARLTGTNELVTISPADARKLRGAATDVVLVTILVHPRDRLAMNLDANGRPIPASIIYTPAT